MKASDLEIPKMTINRLTDLPQPIPLLVLVVVTAILTLAISLATAADRPNVVLLLSVGVTTAA